VFKHQAASKHQASSSKQQASSINHQAANTKMFGSEDPGKKLRKPVCSDSQSLMRNFLLR